MTAPTFRHVRPSYLRLAPRWYDGAARLLDVGCNFDAYLPEPLVGIDRAAHIEDVLMVREDLRSALELLTPTR